MSGGTVKDRDGRVLGFVLPVNGHWAWWRGAAPAPLFWAATREEAISELLTASPAARTNGREPITPPHHLHAVSPRILADSRASVPHHQSYLGTTARQAGDARGTSLLPTVRREVHAEKDNPTVDDTTSWLARRPGGHSTGGDDHA